MSLEEIKNDPEFTTTCTERAAETPRPRRSVPRSVSERYGDIQFIGEGGMAVVYRGVDLKLGRTVALKFLKGDDPSLSRRFVAEAQAQARIQHDNVCRVYEAGQADGEPYIAMQFIDGQPLSQIREQLTIEQGVKLMREVSAAIHEAHRLGMIHRDIKPGNIIVEERDGVRKPYIMDFGLVRHVETRGETETGAILGTPSYMSPEQAKGEVHALDHRSDVYSLGATLYTVVAGRPPFVSDNPARLLMMVAQGDAPPLGKLKPGVPRDLEAIVMKCLEHDPARRYTSAQALSDDLQRVLDNEPIHAKPASLGYVLWKKARKHQVLTALLGAAVIGSLVLAGVWIRAQRMAAEQARLARELGEGVKEMELFLRAAYGLPLHDVERERDVVRARLGEIEQRMAAAGKVGAGPGHYALGRGYLALGDPEQARVHLEQALAAGYSSPDLEYALGRALGENFRRALDETRRITNEAERKRRVAELEKVLRDPALVHLRKAVGARIEAPAYEEGLIALYEGRNVEAIAKAREAFAKAPWMYEPKKLEADALYAEGSKYRHDAAFDYERMKSYFEPAAEAYHLASEIGSSDPDVYRSECELWEKMGWAASAQGLPPAAAFDVAEGACSRAVRASSKDGRALVQRALVLSARIHVLASNVSEETIPAVESALSAAEKGLQARPKDVMAHYAVALALYLRTRVMYELGREASMEAAIAGYERVLSLEPGFTWAVNELGDAYLLEAKKEIAKGRDGARWVESALRQYERAIALDSKFSLPVGGRLDALSVRLEAELDRGLNAEGSLRALMEAVTQLESAGSSPWLVTFWKARANRLGGLHELVQGRDPYLSIQRAMRAIRAFAGEAPKDTWLLAELAECRLIEAAQAEREGLDPAPSLAKAREAAREAGRLRASLSQSLSLLSARIELEGIRAAKRQAGLRPESFDAAFGFVRPLLTPSTMEAAPYVVAAQLHAERAEWLEKSGRGPEEDIRVGLQRVESALSKNPHQAQALFVKGQLYLARARMARTPQERAQDTRRAKEAFEVAVHESPLIAREHQGELKELARLVQ